MDYIQGFQGERKRVQQLLKENTIDELRWKVEQIFKIENSCHFHVLRLPATNSCYFHVLHAVRHPDLEEGAEHGYFFRIFRIT